MLNPMAILMLAVMRNIVVRLIHGNINIDR
jgi:hypothetical protein